MSFTRAALPVLYTQGFNPLARLEFAAPLTVGITACAEIAAADFADEIQTDRFIANLNAGLPEGICVERACIYHIPGGAKKHSLSSLLWGFTYDDGGKIDYVRFTDEKKYRQTRLEQNSSRSAAAFSLKRTGVLARNLNGGTPEWASFFEVYQSLY
jgi:radical SAM-linked protein